MEGDSYEHSNNSVIKTEDIKKRGRKGRQTTKEEIVLENPEDISIEASEDDEPNFNEEKGMSTRGRSLSMQNKQSNPKGERKQSNAKGERKQSNPKGERKPSNPKGERKQSNAKGERKDEETKSPLKNKRQTRKTKSMEVEESTHSDDDEDEICEVCYSGVSEPFLNEEMKSLFEIIRCRECEMAVHKICYGYKTYQNAQNFLCDECREGVEDAKCYICGVDEGCLRLIKKDQWIHNLCGITNGTVQYKDVSTMEIDLHDFKKETQKLSAIRKCQECENKVETIQTENQESPQYCHLHCALKTNIPTQDQKPHWDVKFSLKNEENFHVYKHFDEKKLMSHIEGLQLKLKDILQKSLIAKETEANQALFEMKEKKGTRGKRGEKRVDRSNEDIEESLTIALETVKEVAKQSYEGLNPVQENDQDLKIIGGKISLTAEQTHKTNHRKHKNAKKTLGMEEETQGSNYTDEELSSILISLNKEIANPLSILEVYSQNKFSKLRSDLPEFPTLENLSFPELLFFVIIFQIRAEAVSDNLSTAQDLCKLANSAKLLPFTLSSFLRMINEKFYLSVATDLLVKPWVALCYPKSAYNPTEKKFDHELMGRNSDAMITCQQILDLFTKKPCGVITSEFELGMQYYQNLSFLQEFYNSVSGLFEESPRNRSSSPDKNKTPKKGSLLAFPDDLPEVHVSLIMELSAKRAALGFIDQQLEELKLLDKFNNRSAVTLNVDSFFKSAEKSSSSSKKSRFSDSCSKSANSSVNKSMYTELAAGKLSLGKALVQSPVKAETKNLIIENPESLATLNKMVEELYKERVTELNEKESVVNAEKKLKQMKAKLGSTKNREADPEVALLEAKINKAKLWMLEFRDAEKKKQDLEEFLDNMGELDFRVNEMNKALNYERKWLLWRNAAQNLSCQLKQKNSPEDQENSKSNVKNLEGIVKEGEELKHVRKDDGLLAGLNAQLAIIKQVQVAVKDHDCKLERLLELENNLKHINIHLPEADKLKLKIQLIKELERFSRDFISLTNLEEFFKTFTDHIDLIGNYQMQMEIKNQIEQGRDIQNKAKNKLPINIDADLFEAQEMAQLVKQTRESRMIIDQVTQVENEVNRVLCLWQVYACFTQDKLPTTEQLENGEFHHLEGKSLKQILQDCEELLAGKILNLRHERVNILTELVKQASTPLEYKSEFHQKLEKFFECLDGAISTECINQVADTMEVETINESEQQELSKDEKIQFIEKAASIAVLNLSNQIYFDMLDQLGLQVGASFNEMFELAEAKAIKLNKIHTKIEHIAHTEDFSEEVKLKIMTIKQLKERSDWIYRVATNKQARGLSGWRYSDLKNFVEKSEELGIPSNFAICRELTEMLKIGETMKQAYEVRYGKLRREILEGKKPAKLFTEDVDGIIISFLAGQVCLEDEINEIGEDVNKVVAWTKSIESTTQAFINGLEYNNFEGTEESLKDKLNRFRETKLAVKDRKGDKSLKLLAWLADAEEAMTGKPDLFELGTFEKFRKESEDWIKRGIKLEKLVDKINDQISSANLIMETAAGLKEVENNAKDPGYTYETLLEFLSTISSSKVELKEERQYFNDIAHKSRLLKEGVEMMKKEGASRMTINDLQMKLMEMGSVPIKWEEELVFVQEAKNQATKTIEMCKEFEKNKTFENLKKVAEHYKNCLLHHEKAEECEKTYDQILKNQDILKAKLEEINAFSMSFEELQDLREKAQLLAEYIKQDWIQELKVTIFFKLCKALQNMTDLTLVSSEQLKSMLQEGSSMAPQDDQTKEALTIIQETLPKVEALEKEREEEIQRQKELERALEEQQNYDDYPEPAVEPEISESSTPLPQYKVTDLQDYLIKEQEDQQLKKAIEPFTPQTEQEHHYVGAIKKILNTSEYLQASDLQVSTYARCIIATFPEVLDSLDAFARVTGRLQTLLKYPFITKRLVRRNFESTYLSKLIRKEESDLKSYEKRLRDHNGIMDSQEKGLAPHESLTKKLKTDGTETTPFSPSKDLEDDSPPLSPEKQDGVISPNPFAACHIDKLSRTDSGRRRNPLRKLLKGEDVSDFFNDEEDSRKFGLQESNPNIEDQEVFSENEEEKQYQGVQPESEIKYDRNLLARPLKASVGKGQHKTAETILYDPDNPNAEPEKTNSDENHKDPRKRLKQNKENLGSERLPDFKKMSPGSILRIFDGILKQADSNKGFKTEFFTCDPYNVVNTLPQIVKEGHASLKITGKFSLSKFQAYFNKCLNNFTAKKNKEEVVVSGWIESHVEMYQRELEEISSELDTSNKVIMISYNESSKIYVLTSKQFNPQWRRLLEFKFKKVQKDSRPYLHFIIIHKPYKLTHDTISLVPDPVPEFGGNNPIFDLNSVHNFEIIKRKHRRADSDDASLLLEQNTESNAYDMGGEDLWDQRPVVSQPTIPRNNKPYNPTIKSFNTKRSWEETRNDTEDKFNDELGTHTNGDPTKKIKSEVGFVMKYLDAEQKSENKRYEPTTTFEEESFFQQDDLQEEPVGELDVMVRKMAKMDRADLIRILEDMEEQDIVELATKMDQRMRDNVISILKDLNKKESQDHHKIPKRSKAYQPPQHIKAFYTLFTPEQMNLARKRVESGYQVPVKEESLIQTIPEDDDDFGAIVPESSSARLPKIVHRPASQMQNNFAPKGFHQNYRKPSVPIQVTDKTIQMPKQIFDLLSQIQNTPMQRVLAVNQTKPAINPHQNNQGGNKIFLNKFPTNKENQSLGNPAAATKFNQGIKFNYQKQVTNSMKLFNNNNNNNKRVSFNN